MKENKDRLAGENLRIVCVEILTTTLTIDLITTQVYIKIICLQTNEKISRGQLGSPFHFGS